MGSEPPEEEGHDGHGHGLGFVLTLNVIINGVLSALAGYGIALLYTRQYEILWYTHEARRTVGDELLLEELAGGAGPTAMIVTVIVGAIIYWQWDRGDLTPTDRTLFELRSPRSRSMHVVVTAVFLGVLFGLFAVLNGVIGLEAAGGLEEVSTGSFEIARAAANGLAGAAAAAYVSVSWVVNLSRGNLVDKSDQGNALSRLSLWSSENARKVVAGVLVITLVLGSGIADINTDVDAADVLPRGNPNTEAAHNLSDRFQSSFTQQVTLQFRVNPDQCRADSRENIPQRSESEMYCGNISDEVYVRAMEEFFVFLQGYSYEVEGGLFEDDEVRESPFEFMIGLPSFYKTINWTMEGGQGGALTPPAEPGSFNLPPPDDRDRWHSLNQTTWAAIADTIEPTLDPSHDQAALLFLVPPKTDLTAREIGEFAINAREAYMEWAPENADYKVFVEDPRNDQHEEKRVNPQFTVDLPLANAHGSELVEEDLRLLMPLIGYFIAVTLFLAFRNVKSVLIAGGSLSLGVVWTYGLMGHTDIALNPLNLTVVPLIMGTGIDYSIHMINEFLEHKSEGRTDGEAFRIAGERAGFAMFIASTVTIVGLLVMVASPSLLLAQVGFLSAVAIASIYLLTMMFIPAVLTLTSGTDQMGADFKPSSWIPAVGNFISRHRVFFSLLVVAATVASGIGIQALTIEEFGEPALNWPEDDPMRQEHEESLAGFYDTPIDEPTQKANIVVVQGDVSQYDTHVYLDAMQENLSQEAQDSDVVNMDTSINLPDLIRTWLKVRDGPESVLTGSLSEQFQQRGYENQSQYPQTREEIQETFDNIFSSPLATFASLFLDYPENNITTITVTVQTGSFERAEGAWNSYEAAKANAQPAKPDDVHTTFVGNTATNYLFVQEELPWLNFMSYIALASVVLLVFAFTRSLRASLAVGIIVGGTSLWLLAFLPLIDIGLAITLMLPLVFVFNIGSDFAVHLIWNIQKVGDVAQVYSTVGKAIFFSALTSIGAFTLFTPWTGLRGIRNLMVRDAMEATVVAIALVFLGTIVVTSIFYEVVSAEEGEGEGAGEVTAGEAPDTDLPSVTVRTENP